MDDISVIEINDDADIDKIDVDKIDVDKNDVDKIFTFDDIGDKPHNEMDKVQLKFHQTVKINGDSKYEIDSLCVSDDKKLAYIKYSCSVIDMNNKDKKITLDLDNYGFYCTFNLKGEFILCNEEFVHITFGSHKIIWIYSTQTKNSKWECKRFYRIPEDYELISISKYDNVYLVSNDYIYEWNINTEKSVKIFCNNKDKNKVINIIKLFSTQSSMLNYN
ncbi:hypothetical protein RhiirA4_466216 [Rhizophagus irregularis]|uniref:Uncharacterized protein n=1 Tax=Rhizophagus irregularis TaxID=588596 RepID=A0A2I1GTQ4_9GLOM|nr:hypothetical protein RhiirA4_466216 [Rhizophagus irregularis]